MPLPTELVTATTLCRPAQAPLRGPLPHLRLVAVPLAIGSGLGGSALSSSTQPWAHWELRELVVTWTATHPIPSSIATYHFSVVTHLTSEVLICISFLLSGSKQFSWFRDTFSITWLLCSVIP